MEKIQSTKFDIVPLDKMLPLKTVINSFKDNYASSGVDNFFDRKWQRLREVCFSLFVCRALDLMEKKEHFLLFYEKQDRNDVSYISFDTMGGKGNIQYFDVKEFVPNCSTNFDVFVQNIVNKSLKKDYKIILGVHKDILEGDMKKIDWTSMKKGMFLVFGLNEENEVWFRARVVFISGGYVLFDEIIDLSGLVSEEDVDVIFHDEFNFKVGLGSIQSPPQKK